MVGVVKQVKKATGELLEYNIEMGKVVIQSEPAPVVYQAPSYQAQSYQPPIYQQV